MQVNLPDARTATSLKIALFQPYVLPAFYIHDQELYQGAATLLFKYLKVVS